MSTDNEITRPNWNRFTKEELVNYLDTLFCDHCPYCECDDEEFAFRVDELYTDYLILVSAEEEDDE